MHLSELLDHSAQGISGDVADGRWRFIAEAVTVEIEIDHGGVVVIENRYIRGTEEEIEK